MIFGAPITVSQFLVWNLLPVTIGNIVAGALFTGAALYATYPSVAAQDSSTAPQTAAAQTGQNTPFAPVSAASLNPL
jgi:hypothetical protein